MLLSEQEIHEDYKALRGDKPKRYIEIYRAAEAAILAKLAIAELPEPVARTMRLIGNDDYAKKRGYCARTYNELPKGMYSDTWQDLELLYTYDQLRQAFAQGAAAQLDRLEKAEKDAERYRFALDDREFAVCEFNNNRRRWVPIRDNASIDKAMEASK